MDRAHFGFSEHAFGHDRLGIVRVSSTRAPIGHEHARLVPRPLFRAPIWSRIAHDLLQVYQSKNL